MSLFSKNYVVCINTDLEMLKKLSTFGSLKTPTVFLNYFSFQYRQNQNRGVSTEE